MNHRPLFICGFQRSGTTLLQGLIGSHSRIVGPPEVHFFFRIHQLRRHYGDLAEDSNLEAAVHDLVNPTVELFRGWPLDEAAVLSRARADRTYAGLLRALMDHFADLAGKHRWCEKTPHQRVAEVRRLLPEAQTIHLLRDPRDVVASSLEAPWERRSARQIAISWRSFTLDNIRAGSRAGPDSYLQLRYEDLTRDPDAVLRVVCAFLGEDHEPGMADDTGQRSQAVANPAASWQHGVASAITADRQQTWRSRLSPGDAVRTSGVVEDLLPALGYERSPRKIAVAARLHSSVKAPLEAASQLSRDRRAPATIDPAEHHRRVQDHISELRDRLHEKGHQM